MLRLIYICFFVVSSFQLFAQDNGVKLNPLALLGGDLEVYYERPITDNSSFTVGTSLSSIKFEAIRYTGVSILGEYRVYTSLFRSDSQVFEGFYFGPFTRFRYSTSELGGGYSFLNVGGMVGHQWTLKDRFLIDAFVGPYFNVVLSEDERYNTDAVRYFGKYSTRIGVSVGILL